MAQNKNIGRRALGRGLSNLIPTVDDGEVNQNEIQLIDVEAIVPNPFQPRTDFKEEEIMGLAESIRTQGLMQPILVRKSKGKFEIIAGERRFRAMRSLEYDKVPCIIKAQASDKEVLELALVENVQREDLNEIEKARAYQNLIDQCGLSHEEISQRIGKNRTVVTNTLRLLKLPLEIQEMVREAALTMGHARALLSLDEEQQLEMARKIVANSLTVRDVETATKIVKEKNVPTGVKKVATEDESDPDTVMIIEKLRYRFGTDVKIKENAKHAGAITLVYYSRDDLNRILDLLVK
jgi:ParB family chromosome partitioning protein